jgi:hypothetical protein
MLRAMSRIAAALLFLVGLAAPALGQPRVESPLRAAARGQDYPVVELVTMGVGSLIWERHGHIALCVIYADERADACYNYGIGDFGHPLQMTSAFFRGANSFWAGKMDPMEMLSIYVYADRSIWVQPLPLDAAQKEKAIDALEHDVLPQYRYYAYDHFWDNCTTRVRDVIDQATGGALSSMTASTDGRSYRDLARAGFLGMRIPLIITDIAMGRATDREPSYFERMFLPDYLREAVTTRWGVKPIEIYTRKGPPAPDDGPSGRVLFALVVLALTAPAWATRLWGRFQRAGLAFAVIPMWLLGTVFWVLAIISPLPYVRWNESCLLLLPTDLLLIVGPRAWRHWYARGRVIGLGLCAFLLAFGVLKQPLWAELVWPLVPNLVVAYWPAREQARPSEQGRRASRDRRR